MKGLLLILLLVSFTLANANECTEKYAKKAIVVENVTDIAKIGVAMAIVIPATVGSFMLGPIMGVWTATQVGVVYYGGIAAGGSVFFFNPTNQYAQMLKILDGAYNNDGEEKFANRYAKRLAKCSNLTQEEAVTLFQQTTIDMNASGKLCEGKRPLKPRKLLKQLKTQYCQ